MTATWWREVRLQKVCGKRTERKFVRREALRTTETADTPRQRRRRDFAWVRRARAHNREELRLRPAALRTRCLLALAVWRARRAGRGHAVRCERAGNTLRLPLELSLQPRRIQASRFYCVSCGFVPLTVRRV